MVRAGDHHNWFQIKLKGVWKLVFADRIQSAIDSGMPNNRKRTMDSSIRHPSSMNIFGWNSDLLVVVSLTYTMIFGRWYNITGGASFSNRQGEVTSDWTKLKSRPVCANPKFRTIYISLSGIHTTDSKIFLNKLKLPDLYFFFSSYFSSEQTHSF